MKDILNLEVNIATKEGSKLRHLVLTAGNDEEIKEKLNDWLFITRLKDKGHIDRFTVTRRIQPVQEEEYPRKQANHSKRQRGT